MNSFSENQPAIEALERESLSWLNRLLSGSMSEAELDAFHAWRAQSARHDQAFGDAVDLRMAVRSAVLARRAAGAPGTVAPVRPAYSRRAVWAGGFAVAASVAGGMIVSPPGGLWSSLAAMMSDYQTHVGEIRSVRAADKVSLVLNTQTSVDHRGVDGAPGIELVSGEIEVASARSAQSPFVVSAGQGRVQVGAGRLNVSKLGETVCVTCLEREAVVLLGGRRVEIGAAHQVAWAGARLGEPEPADLELVTAWRRHLLIFRNAPLQQVVQELNRYRAGKIVLVNHALAQRPIYGVFQTRHLDGAVAEVSRLTGARATELPGGVLLLG